MANNIWIGRAAVDKAREETKETLELLDLLKGWRPKGQIVYRLRKLGVDWKRIDAIVSGGASLAGRWAKTHGKEWPV